MELLEFVKLVGVSGFIIVAATALAYKIANRESQLRAEDIRSHLDDTETLRDFAKEDRAALADALRRIAILSDSNYNLASEYAETKTKLGVFQEKTKNELGDCHDAQERMKEQLDQLRRELEELREVLAIKDKKIAEQEMLIKQLRSA